jgi:hypothetical protein
MWDLSLCFWCPGFIVQSADMHVSAFNPSSVQLGTGLDTWYLRIYKHERALTKRMCYNMMVSTHPCRHAQSVMGPECSNNICNLTKLFNLTKCLDYKPWNTFYLVLGFRIISVFSRILVLRYKPFRRLPRNIIQTMSWWIWLFLQV